MKGIILHGGHGTRLRPLTHTGPKQLLPIANKPMSQFCLEAISETGIKDIAMIIGGVGSNKVREYYGDGKKFGVNITYIEQDEPKGIAHAIRLCKEFVNDEKFLVFLGDNIIQKPIIDFVQNFKNLDYDATVLLCEVDNPSRFGIADIENGKILKITEKPKNPTSNLAVTGIYLLSPIIFEIIDNLKPSWRNELEITDALDNLLKQNNNISFEKITDYWKDTGTPEDIIHANGEIIKKILESSGNKITDHITGEGTIIESNVKIKGPVIIGRNCHISLGSSIGPNVSIGDNTTISVSSVENSIIMKNCKINSVAEIKESIIANNSEIKDEAGTEKVFLLGEGSKLSL
ncbi:MAG: glucose-1-phosphate thymidylyltransferase [Candidatus Nitrosopelagicus sp.]|nr:glucose-1-phosphate thymidylyltransferase [Candidatus Nitrosopelagicus sp.]|tara:strand:+ start:21 stop:1061 length:1041 start_codon:yes stop_codon:yes gene_type:complete